jgi:hypothetical protein
MCSRPPSRWTHPMPPICWPACRRLNSRRYALWLAKPLSSSALRLSVWGFVCHETEFSSARQGQWVTRVLICPISIYYLLHDARHEREKYTTAGQVASIGDSFQMPVRALESAASKRSRSFLTPAPPTATTELPRPFPMLEYPRRMFELFQASIGRGGNNDAARDSALAVAKGLHAAGLRDGQGQIIVHLPCSIHARLQASPAQS